MKTFHYSRAVPLLILPFSLLLLQSRPTEPIQTAGVVAAVSPYYPASARQARVIGDVSAEVRIDSAGVVKSVKIILGHPLFRQAAEMAAWQWKFSSESKESGVRTVVLTFLFRLTPPCSDPTNSKSEQKWSLPLVMIAQLHSGKSCGVAIPWQKLRSLTRRFQPTAETRGG